MASAEHYNWNGELRVAKDGQPYSLSQFMQHYGKNWEQHWEEAARISLAEQQRIQLLGQQLQQQALQQEQQQQQQQKEIDDSRERRYRDGLGPRAPVAPESTQLLRI